MKVYFYDKDTLKKELKNKNNKILTIRFKTHKSVDIPKNILLFIQEISKKDKKFVKTLISSETNFLFFLSNLIKK
jgi:hypothetical protein